MKQEEMRISMVEKRHYYNSFDYRKFAIDRPGATHNFLNHTS
jgi:hypothetical protein